MKQYLHFKKLISLILLLALIVGLIPPNEFTSYATIDEISNFDLSGDGKVVANYDDSNPTDKKIVITGEGTIKYDNWVAMAQKINPAYYNNVENSTRAWHIDNEEDFNIVFNSTNDNDIKLCGSAGYMQGLFTGFSGDIRFDKLVNLAPDVTNLSFIFAYAPKFNQPLDNWNVSNVTDMGYMFKGAHAFNQSLNNWHVSNVTNMSYMFNDADNFNQPLNNWHVNNVTNMSYMFKGAKTFDQPLNNWKTDGVTNMRSMFYDATTFNQPLDSWKTDNVTNMRSMFTGATSFNQSLNEWNVSNVSDMSYMFKGAKTFDQPLNNWKTDDVTNMRSMFYDASTFNQPLNSWKTDNVTNMRSMFAGATTFNQSLNKWNVSNVTDMSYLFKGAKAFNQPLNNWKTDDVTNMRSMFKGAYAFNQPLNNWNTANVTNMNEMFSDTMHYEKSIELNISSLTDGITSAFMGCASANITLNNQANNKDIDAADAFNNMSLSYLEFSGLKNAKINSFSGDYIVEDVVTKTTTACALNTPFIFTDNRHYKVYLAPKNELIINDIRKDYQLGQTTNESLDLAALMPDDAGVITTSMGAISGTNMSILTNLRMSGNTIDYQLSGSGSIGDTAILPFTINSTNYQEVNFNLVIKLIGTPKKQLSDCIINPIPNQTYTGSEIKPSLTITDSGYQLKKDFDYSTVYTENIAIGMAKVSITGKANYEGDVSKYFSIVAATPQDDDDDVTGNNDDDNNNDNNNDGNNSDDNHNDDNHNDNDNNDNDNNDNDNNDNDNNDNNHNGNDNNDIDNNDIDNNDNDNNDNDDSEDSNSEDISSDDENNIDTNNINEDDNADNSQSDEGAVFIKTPPREATALKQPTTPQNSTKHSRSANDFSDVKRGDWFNKAVDYVIKKSLMNGTSNNTFSPRLKITRAMIVTVLYRLAGEPAVSSRSTFSDIANNMWYSKPVTWSQANGVAKGYQDGSFKPNDSLTREQLVAMLYRYANAKQYDVGAKTNLTSYSDSANITPYARDAMQWAVKNGVIKGTTATTLAPQGHATRAQLATIITRFNELFTK